jgi:hypothetical protein
MPVRGGSNADGRIAGIVVFGDPNRGDNFPGTLNDNVLTICDLADPICYGVPLPIVSLTLDASIKSLSN